MDRKTGVAIATAEKRTINLGEFGASADEWPSGCHRRVNKADAAPDADRSRQPVELRFSQRSGTDSIGQGSMQGVGEQDLTGPGSIGKTGCQVHGVSGHRVFAECLTSGPGGDNLAA